MRQRSFPRTGFALRPGTPSTRVPVTAALGTALLLAGCSDSPSEPAPDPDPAPEEGVVKGEVVAPQPAVEGAALTETSHASGGEGEEGAASTHLPGTAAEAALAGEAPVAGAEVTIYELDAYAVEGEGAEPVATATTDADGVYEADGVPEGADLLVLVDSEPRLAALAHDVDDGASADVGTSSTLAAERWGPDVVEGNPVSQADYETAVEGARTALAGRSPEMLADVLETLTPEAYGGGFPEAVSSGMLAVISALEGADLSACENLQLASSGARPTADVGVMGLDAALGDDPWAWIYDVEADPAGEGTRILGYVERTGPDAGILDVPVHPGDLMGGGGAEIVFFDDDDDLHCPGLAFEVEPLEPAPGALEAMVDAMEEIFEEEALRLGQDPDDLRQADIAGIPQEDAHLVPVAAGLQAVDGPDYEDNLRARLSGDAPMLDGEPMDPESLELMDALVAEGGLLEEVEAIRDAWTGGEAPTAGGDAAAGDHYLPAAGGGGSGSCPDFPSQISTPAELDCWMDRQAQYAETRQEHKEPLLDRARENIARASILYYILPEDKMEKMFGPSATAADVSEYVTMMADGVDAALPSDLVGISLEATEPEYWEEWDHEGSWSSELLAVSGSWTADVLLTLSVADVSPTGRGARMIARHGDRSDAVLNATDEVASHMDDALEKLGLGEHEWDELHFPVTIDPERPEEEDYIDWELETERTEDGEPPFVLLDDPTQYEPRGVGRSALRVSTPGGDVFQGQVVHNSETLEVTAIDVRIEEFETEMARSTYSVDPGEELHLWARVDNAQDKEVEWALYEEDGIPPADFEIMGSTNQSATFVAPDEEADYRLEAESMTEAGLREGRDPPRTDEVRIVVGDIPELQLHAPGCQPLDETTQLAASFGEVEIPFSDLEVTVDGPGVVESDGTLVPQDLGWVTIEIEYHDPDTDATFTDEATLEISQGCGFFTAESAHFEHTSQCVGARFFDVEVPTSLVGSYHDTFVLELAVVQRDLSTSGEWTLTRELLPSSGGYGWYFTVEESGGREWIPDPQAGNPVLTVERHEEEVNGRTVGYLSGSFQLDMVVADGHPDEGTRTQVTGEFEDVRYGDEGCGLLGARPNVEP